MQSELERLLRATAHRFPDPEPTVTARVRAELLRQWRALRRRPGWLRRGALHIAAAVLVAGAFGVGKMTAAEPAPISVQPTQLVVDRGTHATFTGRVPGGEVGREVRVQVSRCGDRGFVEHGRTTTGADGRFRVSGGPVFGRSYYRFTSGRSRSGVIAIGARPLVTIAYAPERAGLGVAVYAGDADVPRRALVQRYDRARASWSTVAVAPLRRDVGFISGSIALAASSGEAYRAVVPAGFSCLSQSVSKVLFVR